MVSALHPTEVCKTIFLIQPSGLAPYPHQPKALQVPRGTAPKFPSTPFHLYCTIDPSRMDTDEDRSSAEMEWNFHGVPGNSDSDNDGIPDSEEPGPNFTMVEGTPPSILDKMGRDAEDEKTTEERT